MGWKHNPTFGLTQPGLMAGRAAQSRGMGRPTKPPLECDRWHKVAQAAITRRLREMFPSSTDTDRYEKLYKLSGVAAETLRRFMKGETSMTLRNLVLIANAISLTLPALFGAPMDAGRVDSSADSEQTVQLHRRRN